MRIVIFGFLVLGICISCSIEQDKQTKIDQQLINRIGQFYIKDSRVEVFEYEITSSNGKVIINGSTTNEQLKDSLERYVAALGDTMNQVNLMLLPADSLENTWGLVNLSVSNIRSKNAHSSELVTQATFGTPIRILSKKGEWWQVQTPDEYIGWVDESGIHPLTEQELAKWKEAERVIFTEFAGRILEAPDESASFVSDIVMGGILVEQGKEKKGYLKVKMPDGRTGWLDRYEIQSLDHQMQLFQNAKAVDLEQIGSAMMGIPYLWGGTSSKAVDCSGFTKTIFFMNGWIMPRDASQQVKVGHEIELTDSLEHLSPGDLIYFGRIRKDGSPKITHVALHLGNRRILHSSGKVKIESLNPGDSLFNEYRFNTMITARRIIGDSNKTSVQTVMDHPWYY